MKQKKDRWLPILSLMIAVLMMTGCDNSSSRKKQTPITAPLTGDVSMFPNAGLLASAEDLIDDGKIRRNGPVLVDTRSAEAYAAGHIPGAINLQWQPFAVWDGSATDGSLLPDADLAAALGAVGLTRDTRIIFYDDTLASWGSAGRFFWMLEYLGNIDVQILNGGWDKWAADGLPTETTANTLPVAEFVPSVKTSVLADKDDIAAKRGNADFVLVDTRTDEEFIGWTLYDEARGGHIPGAVQLPYEWYYNADKSILSYEDLKAMFDARGITANKEVVGYCTAGIRSGFLYFLGRLMGFDRIANYDASMWDWAADSNLPMEKLARYEKLVSVSWLKDLIDGQPVPNAPAGRYMLVGVEDVDDAESLIPGSILVSSLEWEMPPTEVIAGAGDLWPDAVWKSNIENMGIDKDTTVILYTSIPGDRYIYATRLLWALIYAGVEDVRLLNGGIDEWLARGYEVVSTPVERTPVDFGTAPGAFPVHPEYLATTGYIEEVVAGDHTDAVIADIRSWGEYIGGPNDYAIINIPLTVQGRIPGARWAHWGPTTLGGGHFWDDDHTLRSYPEVVALWEDWGITSDKTVSYYCGTGWRSTLGWFYGYLMGWENIKNYDDSFFGWSMTSASAAQHGIETGIPSDAPENAPEG